jgi:hypothetical protein
VTLRADGTVFLDDLPIPRAALGGALHGRNRALLAAAGAQTAALETRNSR